jgi:hypothetical protein
VTLPIYVLTYLYMSHVRAFAKYSKINAQSEKKHFFYDESIILIFCHGIMNDIDDTHI